MMRLRKIPYIVFIIAVFLCLSCKYKETNKKDNTVNLLTAEDSFSSESSIPRGGFYQSSLLADSTYVCLFANGNSRSFFYSDTANIVYAAKCKLSGEDVDTIRSVQILENEWSYLTIDSLSFRQLKIKGEPYIFFSSSEGFMGNAVIERNVNFHLINLNTLDNYRLLYAGEPSFKCDECIEGHFVITDRLRAAPLILDSLLAMSKTSKYIYQRGKRDDDKYYYMNYESKWDEDNNSHNTYSAGYGEIVTPLHSTYYKTNLFELNRGSENDVIENGKYKIIAYFRGNIIGYNKKKKLYFPIFLESCVLSCDKSIEFTREGNLKITRTELNDEVYTISLDDILFDGKIGD